MDYHAAYTGMCGRLQQCRSDRISFWIQGTKDTRIEYYDESFSMFYEMKRWVNSYDQMQELIG